MKKKSYAEHSLLTGLFGRYGPLCRLPCRLQRKKYRQQEDLTVRVGMQTEEINIDDTLLLDHYRPL